MKKLLCLLLALACILGVSAVGVFADEAGDIPSVDAFGDLDSQRYYYDGVEYCVENSLMNGLSATAFGPNEYMSRAMFVTVLWRMAGEPAVAEGFAGTAFTDVPEVCYYRSAVEWAVSCGIVNGISDTLFGPDVLITREMMCALMVRYAEYMEYYMPVYFDEDITAEWYMVESMMSALEAEVLPEWGSLFAFDDTVMMSKYALLPIYSCYEMGIINGVSETEFDPKGTATRGQVATVLKRFVYNVAVEMTFAEDGDTVAYTYTDPFGNVTATEKVTFDENENPISTVFTEGDYSYTEEYTYDATDGKLLKLVFKDSDGVEYTTTYIPEHSGYVTTDGTYTELTQYDDNGLYRRTVRHNYSDEENSYIDESVYEYYYNEDGSSKSTVIKENYWSSSEGAITELGSVSDVVFSYDHNGNMTGFAMTPKTEESGEYAMDMSVTLEYDVERVEYKLSVTVGEETIHMVFSKTNNAVALSVGGETAVLTLKEFFMSDLLV